MIEKLKPFQRHAQKVCRGKRGKTFLPEKTVNFSMDLKEQNVFGVYKEFWTVPFEVVTEDKAEMWAGLKPRVLPAVVRNSDLTQILFHRGLNQRKRNLRSVFLCLVIFLLRVGMGLSEKRGTGLRMDLNPKRSMPDLKQLPLLCPWEECVASGHSRLPRLCASSSISSPKGPDSERLYEEKNHSGQGHSRDTLLQIPWIESNSVPCGAVVRRSSLPGRKLGRSAQRPYAGTAVLACVACKAVTKKTLFLVPKNDPWLLRE